MVQIDRMKTSGALVYTRVAVSSNGSKEREKMNMNNEPLAEAALAEITRLLLAGQKLHAIKVYRELTGSSLSEAKEALDRLEGVIRLGGDLQSEFALLGGAVSTGTQGALTAEIGQLLARGKKIQAIKLYRERTGASLDEAKNAVDRVEMLIRTRGL